QAVRRVLLVAARPVVRRRKWVARLAVRTEAVKRMPQVAAARPVALQGKRVVELPAAALQAKRELLADRLVALLRVVAVALVSQQLAAERPAQQVQRDRQEQRAGKLAVHLARKRRLPVALPAAAVRAVVRLPVLQGSPVEQRVVRAVMPPHRWAVQQVAVVQVRREPSQQVVVLVALATPQVVTPPVAAVRQRRQADRQATVLVPTARTARAKMARVPLARPVARMVRVTASLVMAVRRSPCQQACPERRCLFLRRAFRVLAAVAGRVVVPLAQERAHRTEQAQPGAAVAVVVVAVLPVAVR
ncbi:MAG TPA: hypothetical protein VKB34_00845, partial [Povalibacter sp.]|nr:hypothetical protein [Povalibacter sp.]